MGGSVLTLADQNGTTADGTTFCAFATGSQPVQFAPVKEGKCTVPMNLTGEVFVTLTKDGASTADDKVIAGYVIKTFLEIPVVCANFLL